MCSKNQQLDQAVEGDPRSRRTVARRTFGGGEDAWGV